MKQDIGGWGTHLHSRRHDELGMSGALYERLGCPERVDTASANGVFAIRAGGKYKVNHSLEFRMRGWKPCDGLKFQYSGEYQDWLIFAAVSDPQPTLPTGKMLEGARQKNWQRADRLLNEQTRKRALVRAANWYRENRERALVRGKQWRLDNDDAATAYNREWKAKNRDKVRSYGRVKYPGQRGKWTGKPVIVQVGTFELEATCVLCRGHMVTVHYEKTGYTERVNRKNVRLAGGK